MDINAHYSKIIEELESGGRALQRFSESEITSLQTIFDAALIERDPETLEKILCIVDHSAVSHKGFEALILKCLSTDLPDRFIVFSLNCSRKHIIAERFKKGLRLDFEFLDILKKLLKHPSIEVVEWTLRTIEECGNQGIYFLKEFDKIKPPPWKWFNAHQRAVREIITLLERRWSRFEKP